MKEIRTGIRHILSTPWVYDTFQNLVGAYSWRKKVIQRFVVPAIPEGGQLIDIGCGTADVLNYLPKDVEYIGFDRNHEYISKAKKLYSQANASFYCRDLTDNFSLTGRLADVVLSLGVVHHLDDSQALELFRLAKNILAPNGVLITLDPVYSHCQSVVARYIISKDRGTGVRNEDGYKSLALKAFKTVDTHIDMNPLRIPYTGIVMLCTAR